ncbi:MAG: hypothetical protein V3T17_11200 [Pseudomonadales bacterium]
MADYYTEASFIIPCSEEQAATAINALDHINGELSECAELAILKADSEELSHEENIIRHCFFNHPEQDESNSVKELDWYFNVETCDEGLWVYTNESINTEQAAIFTQSVLTGFELSSLVEIKAAHTCSKQRTDAFGGHACVVSKDHIRWDGLYEFLEAERKAHAECERYYVCRITEVNGEYEHGSRFLMKCVGNDDPEKRLDDIFVGYRGEGVKEDEDFVRYPDGIAAKNPCMSEITPYEFKVMQPHLSVL